MDLFSRHPFGTLHHFRMRTARRLARLQSVLFVAADPTCQKRNTALLVRRLMPLAGTETMGTTQDRRDLQAKLRLSHAEARRIVRRQATLHFPTAQAMPESCNRPTSTKQAAGSFPGVCVVSRANRGALKAVLCSPTPAANEPGDGSLGSHKAFWGV